MNTNERQKKIITITMTCIVLVGVIACINPMLRYRNYKLSDVIQTVSFQTGSTLEEEIPFEWDCVYYFAPYTPGETMAEKMGFKSRHTYEMLRDDLGTVYCVKDNKVVAFADIESDAPIAQKLSEGVVQYGENKGFAQ